MMLSRRSTQQSSAAGGHEAPRNADTQTRGHSVAESGAQAIRDELRSCLPVFPVLIGQLREAARQVEDAVVGVCGNFQDMAQRARETASQALLGTDLPDGAAGRVGGAIGDLVSGTRETMGKLLERVEQTSSFTTDTAQRMRGIEGRVSALEETLRQIDNVAADARVLALNGQIEAARAGTQGKAFSVVAKETATMAIHALAASKSIQEMIEKISADIAGASAELRQRAAADAREASQSRGEVNRALDAMSALHEQTRQAVETTRRNTGQLARDVAQAVMALQFQDTVNQRIEHVVRTLEEVHSALRKHADDSGAATAGAPLLDSPANDWTEHMAGAYTMAAERHVLAAHAAGSADAHDPPGSVELF